MISWGRLRVLTLNKFFTPLDSSSKLSGGVVKAPWIAPLTSAAARAGGEPTATKVTWLGSIPWACSASRVVVSDVEPNELTPIFLPFRSAIELISWDVEK